MEKEKFLLKDHLFKAEKVAFLANAIQKVYPSFQNEAFQKAVVEAFPNLELKGRIAHIRQCLKDFLPPNYADAITIILKALPPPLDENLTDNDFGDFIFAPYSDFVAHFGCSETHLERSLAAIKALTKRFSAEDAIRYFLNAFPKETLAQLHIWASDTNYHVRRLCSEGTRPKLPWSQKIGLQATETLPLLAQLFSDKTRYVTRSVANHLNDIAKTKPDLVIETLKNWGQLGKQTSTEMAFIKKHALRTLVKDGHPEALALLGFGDSKHIVLSDLQFNTSIKLNEYLNFSFVLYTATTKTLAVDYILRFQNKQGQLGSKKVFKLQTFLLQENTNIMLNKRHLFRANMTTRTFYGGVHKVEIQVNGTILGTFQFDLIA